MTINDLLIDLRIVGESESFSDRNKFIYSINRALRRLYADRKIEKTVKLATRRPEPISYYKEIHSPDGNEIEFPLVGKSYSMRIHGTCTYMINDGGVINVRTVESKNEATVVKGFISYGGTITFWGSFAYTIYDFAVYDEIYSEKAKEIPEYGLKRIFNLRDIYGDFMSFTSPATDLSGNPLKCCRLYDGKVEVDTDYTGEIAISYRCLPEEISLAEDENATEIAVPKEYTHLFVMLVAYYYLYFSDNKNADRFLNQYIDAKKSLVTESYQQIDAKYLDTTGWA